MTVMESTQTTSRESVLKRVLRNAGILLSGRGLNGLLGIGYMALTARALGATQTGALVLINAFALLTGDLVKFQSWQLVLQFGAPALHDGDRARLQQVIRFGLTLDLVSTLVGVVLAMAGASLFSERLGWGRAHAGVATAYMLTIVLMVSATPVGLMRLFDNFGALARQTALVALVRLVGCAIGFALHWGLGGFLLAWTAGQAAGFLYLASVTLRSLRTRGLDQGFRWRGPLSKGLPGVWRFAWSTNLSATLDVALTHVATLMIGGLSGPAPAAFWRIGRQVADGLAKPARLIVHALYPELARMRAAGDEAGMWRLARRIGVLGGGIGTALLAVSALFGPQLLTLALGQAFAPAGEVMTWQVAAVVVGIFALPLEPMLISFGRAGSTVAVQVVVGAFFLAALPFVLHRYGLIGAGAALLIAEIGLASGFLVVLLRHGRRTMKARPVLDDELVRDAME
jgi:O-antigen/teichoic acid export membrane protein